MTIPSLLRACPLFFEIHDREIGYILDQCAVRAYAAGSHVYPFASKSNDLYLMLEGEVELRKPNGSQSKKIELLHEGDIFGESVLSDEKFRGLEAVTLSEAHVLEISYEALVQIFNKKPKVFGLLLLNVSRLLAKRLLKSQDTIFQIAELAQTPTPTSATPAAFRAKIFVLEDDEDIRKVLEMYLSPAFDVRAFANPTEALEAVDAGDIPDLFLSDYMMPEMNGVEFFEVLKEEKIDRPVIFITGVNEYEMAMEALNLGIHHLLEKPVECEMLVRTVRTTLRQHFLLEFNQLLLDQYQTLFGSLAEMLHSLDAQSLAEKLKALIVLSQESYRAIAEKKQIVDSLAGV